MSDGHYDFELNAWKLEAERSQVECKAMRAERDEALAELHKIRTQLAKWKCKHVPFPNVLCATSYDDATNEAYNVIYNLVPDDCWGIEVPS